MPSFLYSSTDSAKFPISHKVQALYPPNKYNKPDSAADNQPSTGHFSAKLLHLAPSYPHSIAVYSQSQCPDRTCAHRWVLISAYAAQPGILRWPWGRRYSSLCGFEGQAKEIHNVIRNKTKKRDVPHRFCFWWFQCSTLAPQFLSGHSTKAQIKDAISKIQPLTSKAFW